MRPKEDSTIKKILLTLSALITLASLSSCSHIELDMNIPSGGMLEDAILITSTGGAAPRETTVLGDIDLTVNNHSFSHDLNAATSTHWWLIGHRSGEVVYSSNVSLGGTDLYAIEPYIGASPLDWNIPANLDAFVKGNTYSADWWAQTVNNHSSHVAPDTNSATLWQFGTTGSDIGTMTMRLHVPN